jgi:prepilin-type N-terminal cleavage/methylation domain-containing protein
MRHHALLPRGFTLVELLIGSSLAAFAMMALLSSFVFLARNFTRLANRQALEGQSHTALAYLRADLTQARAVKSTGPATASSVTLVLPAGEVTYTYDGGAGRLLRETNFSSQPELSLLYGPNCRCTAFAFSYFTGTGGSPAAQLSSSTNTPYSIKQLQVSFELQTPAAESAQTRMQYKTVSARLNLRNRGAPDGS